MAVVEHCCRTEVSVSSAVGHDVVQVSCSSVYKSLCLLNKVLTGPESQRIALVRESRGILSIV